MKHVKVTKTEIHKDSQKGDTIVCKGKLVLIKSALEKHSIKLYDKKNEFEGQYLPFIISETEPIKADDYVLYCGKIYFVFLAEKEQLYFTGNEGIKAYRKDCQKIISLPENLSPKQLQAIVDGKLKDGDDVLVEVHGTDIFWIDGMECEIKLNKDNHITLLPAKKEFTKAEQEAIRRFQNGEKFSVSTFIDEDTIVAGYGQLDHESNPYDFQFPLPSVYINAIYGTTSWDKWMKREDEKRISSNNMKIDFVTP